LESGVARWRAAPSVSRKCGGIFDIGGKRAELSSLDLRMADPSFWSNQEEAQRTLQEVKSLRAWIDPYDKLESRLTTATELHEMLAQSSDTDMERELDDMIESLDSEIDSFEVKTLMRGEDDFRDAQLEIAAGAGGTEAQDWAALLLPIYTRWAARRGSRALRVLLCAEADDGRSAGDDTAR
jgi:peptide chain release factor 2